MNEGQSTRLFMEAEKILNKYKLNVFGVLDGAQYQDLPSVLKQNNINHRALYIGKNEEMIKNGPWFVDPYLPVIEYKENTQAKTEVSVTPLQQLKKIIEISGGKQTLVLWFTKFDAGTVFKHLRSINLVMVPEQDAIPKGRDKNGLPLGNKPVSAIFRHYDGNVLAETLPVMTEIQQERLLRYADGVVFIAPEFPRGDGDIIRWTKCPVISDDKKLSGLLSFDHQQMEKISIRQVQRLDRRTFNYLREVKPKEPFEKSDEELLEFVKYCRETGEEIGFKLELSQWRWAYLMGLTNGTLFLQKLVIDDLKYGGVNPDRQMEALMKDTIKSVREKKFANPNDILDGFKS